MAHFHYTIMGGLIFAVFGGIYYWLPKVMGITMNQKLGKIHFWTMFISSTPRSCRCSRSASLGMPRRVWEYAGEPADAQRLGVDLSAFGLGASHVHLHLQLRDVHGRLAQEGAAEPVERPRPGVAGPVPAPADNFDYIPVVLAGPYEYGDPDALPVADLHPPAGVISGALVIPVEQVPATAEPDGHRHV